LAASIFVLAAATQASAASCGNAAGFPAFLESFKRDAAGQGISAATIAATLDGLSFDPSTVSKDRGQGVFSQTFLQFSDRMVAVYRMKHGAALMKQYASVFQRIESQFGVPAYPIVAFWGLETDFGANTGKDSTLRSLATLAWDCRRPELFRGELLEALRIVQRGDLTPAEMRGPWAGELGQMQFLPSHYVKHAVDFDGDGRRDLIRSAPDALASAGKYLQSLGWKRGEPWLQEVVVPPDLDWKEADLAVKHPRSQWVRWGVRAASGALPGDNLQASLLLPMGRGGAGLSGLSELRHVSRLEPVLRLRDDGRLFRRSPRGGASRAARQPDAGLECARGRRAAALARPPRPQGRQDRRQARAGDASRRQAGAVAPWPGGRLVADPGALGAAALICGAKIKSCRWLETPRPRRYRPTDKARGRDRPSTACTVRAHIGRAPRDIAQ
jgi:lytic murein transglycosylase